MAATSSSTPSQSPGVSNSAAIEFFREIKSHETALAELSNLPSSRAVYQKNGNLYFRTSIQLATTAEQRQLDAAKAKLQKLNSP